MPSSMRPSEISSMVAAAEAVIAGWRVSGFVTAVPSESERVLVEASVRYEYAFRACKDESVHHRLA